MFKKFFLVFLLTIFLILVFASNNFLQAQNIIPPKILQEGGEKFIPKDTNAPIKTSDDIINIIIEIFKIIAEVFWIGAIAGSFYAGYLYLFSFGNEEKTAKAKKMLQYVVIAIAIGLMAYALPTFVYNFLNQNQGTQHQNISPPPKDNQNPLRQV